MFYWLVPVGLIPSLHLVSFLLTSLSLRCAFETSLASPSFISAAADPGMDPITAEMLKADKRFAKHAKTQQREIDAMVKRHQKVSGVWRQQLFMFTAGARGHAENAGGRQR